MNFSRYIAKRYLIAKKSHQAIHYITGISIVGLAFATLALICTLSVFNGFQDMVAQLFTAFDPPLKIVANQGKSFQGDAPELQEIAKWPEIEMTCKTIESFAMVQYKKQQAVVTVKGVEDNFQQMVAIDSVLYGRKKFKLHDEVCSYAVMGIDLMASLGASIEFVDPLILNAPKRKKKISLTNPTTSFNRIPIYSPGVVFAINQQKYDASYVLVSLNVAQKLFNYKNEITALELRLKKDVDVDKIQRHLQQFLGKKYKVMNRYEQQEDVFKVMQIEKLISYIFLSFILFIASFNIIGALSMLIIDKKKDVLVLRSLGASDKMIIQIFLYEGRMIATFGATIGIILGLLLCFLQQTFGFISLGNGAGNFIIDAYPVSVHWWDVIIVFFTVIGVSYLAVWYPIHYLSKKIVFTQ
jgi:lipoprotein-releasing system permease protein